MQVLTTSQNVVIFNAKDANLSNDFWKTILSTDRNIKINYQITIKNQFSQQKRIVCFL